MTRRCPIRRCKSKMPSNVRYDVKQANPSNQTASRRLLVRRRSRTLREILEAAYKNEDETKTFLYQSLQRLRRRKLHYEADGKWMCRWNVHESAKIGHLYNIYTQKVTARSNRACSFQNDVKLVNKWPTPQGMTMPYTERHRWQYWDDDRTPPAMALTSYVRSLL